jgi:hypothetical protein
MHCGIADSACVAGGAAGKQQVILPRAERRVEVTLGGVEGVGGGVHALDGGELAAVRERILALREKNKIRGKTGSVTAAQGIP